MPTDPLRAVCFFDAQNIFKTAKELWDIREPNFDPIRLSTAICNDRGWTLSQVRFYTGVPSRDDNPRWNLYWSRRLLHLKRQGVETFSRQLRRREKKIVLPGGGEYTYPAWEEKGVDIRIAIDVLRLAIHRAYDVVVIFSQDQDLSEVTDEVKLIGREQRRRIEIASAYPFQHGMTNRKGINRTDWIKIPEDVYKANLDPWDYHRMSRA